VKRRLSAGSLFVESTLLYPRMLRTLPGLSQLPQLLSQRSLFSAFTSRISRSENHLLGLTTCAKFFGRRARETADNPGRGRASRRGGAHQMAESQLSSEQQAMEKLWEEHMASEFKAKSAEAAINSP
jgi:hypothetical protein